MLELKIKKLLDEVKFFDKIYDTLRVVDPINKKVIKLTNNETHILDTNCFDFWEQNKVCNNCISMRAYNNNESFVKIEYNDNKTYMITAIPCELSNRRVVVEVLKDVTDSMFVSTIGEQGNAKSEIHALIDNMNNLVIRDPLTQIYNRRYIEEKLPIDLINSDLLSQPISIIMADIDYFKKVNDTYGHTTGDLVLKLFAETLSKCISRGNDWIARYGGEEFLVCLPSAGDIIAKQIAEKMRTAIEETSFQCNENALRITASFGVYTHQPKQSESMHEMIQKVDEKLYLAKRNGRNRIES